MNSKTSFHLDLSKTNLALQTSGLLLFYPFVLGGLLAWAFVGLLGNEPNFMPFFYLLVAYVIFRFSPLLRVMASPFRKLRRIVKNVASKNNLKFYGRTTPVYDELFYPVLKSLGWRARREYGAAGLVAAVPTDVYLQTYRSWVRRDVDRAEVLVFEFELPTLLPHTVLQRRNSRGNSFTTSLERTFDDNQRVGLQNDLDEFFTLYTHRRTVTDALTMWSPQLLESLRDMDALLSVETVGKKAYVYVAPGWRSVDMNKVVEFCNTLVSSLKRTTRTDFLKLPNDAKYPFLRSRPAGGTVAFFGRNYSSAVAFLVVAVVVHGISAFLRGTTSGYIVFGIFTTFALVFYGYMSLARSRYTRTLDKRGH